MTPYPEAARTAAEDQLRALLQRQPGLVKWAPVAVGSAYINDQGNDLDLVVCVTDVDRAEAQLLMDGYKLSQSGDSCTEEDEFTCFRRDDLNVMLTSDADWYWGFIRAADVCRLLRGVLIHKWQRVAVHRVIMNEETPEAAEKRAKELYL